MNQPIQIKIEDIKPFQCECGCSIFSKVFHMRTAPGIIYGQRDPIMVLVPHFVCMGCGTILDYNLNEQQKQVLEQAYQESFAQEADIAEVIDENMEEDPDGQNN